MRLAFKKSLSFGLCIGILFFLIFFVLSEVLYFGAVYHKHYGVEISDLFVAIFGLVFGVFATIAVSFSFPDMGKASVAMEKIF